MTDPKIIGHLSATSDKTTRRKKNAPRPPDILRKSGPMRDKTKYERKEKHPAPKGQGSKK
jgi:hypothetical protein